MRKTAFPPVADATVRVLLLGSMPGEESLRRREYYAHPRNAFWPIMGQLLGFDPAVPYSERLERLLQHRIALWDVLSACYREGSLDSDIKTPEPNDIATFIREHSQLKAVYCNGQTAGRFLKKFFPVLPEGIPVTILPSTSPAHAGLAFPAKLAQWKAIVK